MNDIQNKIDQNRAFIEVLKSRKIPMRGCAEKDEMDRKYNQVLDQKIRELKKLIEQLESILQNPEPNKSRIVC